MAIHARCRASSMQPAVDDLAAQRDGHESPACRGCAGRHLHEKCAVDVRRPADASAGGSPRVCWPAVRGAQRPRNHDPCDDRHHAPTSRKAFTRLSPQEGSGAAAPALPRFEAGAGWHPGHAGKISSLPAVDIQSRALRTRPDECRPACARDQGPGRVDDGPHGADRSAAARVATIHRGEGRLATGHAAAIPVGLSCGVDGHRH